ncbi:tRNA pseudouridine(55) synthase TruB [Candidatus Pandoraea novymonadis]|uniref:tRNA pseudouridine(55) synthase TruB n=1 Tax=Candidatus Pandoraea novymonadis TaxID=1808959 RepID=UPI0015E756B5|nr:tRNA pseudouridine(55) synthase TruB [Candidatus Pandoraea novymonadis]
MPRFALDGVLLLDKPIGLSSNCALMRAKYLLQALKAGHTGTLDPLATGLLPLCFGEATKFSQGLLNADKTYEACVRLGQTTTTGDAEGEIIERKPVMCDADVVCAMLPRFVGRISQVPPMYSALKFDGKPLYEYARAGKMVERKSREVTIRTLEMLSWLGNSSSNNQGQFETPTFTLRVTCSKGTYIRTLAEDIGIMLGCGAHLTALRRTAVGQLDLSDALSLDVLSVMAHQERIDKLAPVDTLLKTLPYICLDESLSKRFCYGQRLRLDKTRFAQMLYETGIHSEIEVRVYRESVQSDFDQMKSRHFLGVAKIGPEALLKPQCLLVASTQ